MTRHGDRALYVRPGNLTREQAEQWELAEQAARPMIPCDCACSDGCGCPPGVCRCEGACPE